MSLLGKPQNYYRTLLTPISEQSSVSLTVRKMNSASAESMAAITNGVPRMPWVLPQENALAYIKGVKKLLTERQFILYASIWPIPMPFRIPISVINVSTPSLCL
mmetsp:Transcript_118294/g.209080  ORF Transcript_118294/g.209080 Transcript_118294/m.209080 type:complete len:104 (+) Transcript_118294:113-424(+)